MANGAEPAGAEALAHTIYIWPSRRLIARSWRWPEAWHAAFEQAASQIGRAVAVCVLGGLPVSRRPITMELSIGCVSFRARRRGMSIQVAITKFEGPEPTGPDAPGPGGGCQQPRAADGLILGLRGSGKSFALVTFYGYLPPLPAAYGLPSGIFGQAATYDSFACAPQTSCPHGVGEKRRPPSERKKTAAWNQPRRTPSFDGSHC